MNEDELKAYLAQLKLRTTRASNLLREHIQWQSRDEYCWRIEFFGGNAEVFPYTYSDLIKITVRPNYDFGVAIYTSRELFDALNMFPGDLLQEFGHLMDYSVISTNWFNSVVCVTMDAVDLVTTGLQSEWDIPMCPIKDFRKELRRRLMLNLAG